MGKSGSAPRFCAAASARSRCTRLHGMPETGRSLVPPLFPAGRERTRKKYRDPFRCGGDHCRCVFQRGSGLQQSERLHLVLLRCHTYGGIWRFPELHCREGGRICQRRLVVRRRRTLPGCVAGETRTRPFCHRRDLCKSCER